MQEGVDDLVVVSIRCWYWSVGSNGLQSLIFLAPTAQLPQRAQPRPSTLQRSIDQMGNFQTNHSSYGRNQHRNGQCDGTSKNVPLAALEVSFGYSGEKMHIKCLLRHLRKLLLLRGDVIGVHDYPATHFDNCEPAMSVRSDNASESIRDGVRTWRSILIFLGAKAVLISSYCCIA